jgi:DNA-binding response OmpR family regulator
MSQMHIDAYFHKPLDPCHLLAKIEELLAGAGAGSS